MTEKQKALRNIMERSGNTFHSDVVRELRDLDWAVLVSPHYSDNYTDKPREIDIVAERYFPVEDGFRQLKGHIKVQLFIECKYVSNETIFWFDDKNFTQAAQRIASDTGIPNPETNRDSQKHHYYANHPVAKFFATDSKRFDDNDDISKAIIQCLNATIYFRNDGRVNVIQKQTNQQNISFLRSVSYPIILLNSLEKLNLVKIGAEKDVEPKPITDSFQLEKNYVYHSESGKARNDYFLIDVTSLTKLPEFLVTQIKSDVDVIAEDIIWNRRENGASSGDQHLGIYYI